MSDYQLLCSIVNAEQGSRVLKIAKRHGIKAGTIMLGLGTIKNKWLELLDLNDCHKEIVLMVSSRAYVQEAMESLAKEMAFLKPHHGIVFSMPLTSYIGTMDWEYDEEEETVVEKIMHQAIYVVVEKGLAEDVVEVATKAGARGGTIINARGSDVNDTSMLFAMAIEPEKELVMILVEREITKAIVLAVSDAFHLEEAGNGVLFVMNVTQAIGLY